MNKLILLILICFVLPLSADDKAPLGSPDFYPSTEHPIGWRGDGTGRFPGATPPVTWDRRLADITSEIMVQTSKPDGKPGVDSRHLEYFTLKDWLITGPFTAPDPEKDIENDFLGGEAEIQPSAGDKAGDTKWKIHRAYEGAQGYRNHNEHTSTHLYVDFVYAYGKLDKPVKGIQYANLDKRAAYAHTYLYAPREADVFLDMLHELPAVKMWVNGVSLRVKKSSRRPVTIKIHLKQGWNRLLVKAICDKAQKPWRSKYASPNGVLGKIQWRFATYIRPADSGPFPYKTKNISWMLKLTGRNASQPIVVGDKIFVGSGDTDLFCLDKANGKILWLHTVTYRDAMTDEQYAAVREKAAPLLKELEKVNQEMVSLLNENIFSVGLDTERQAMIDRKLEKRNKLAMSVHRSLSDGKKGRLYDNEVSAGNATPASDGKLVYWVVQGNGGYLTSAFDLDGKKIWSSFEYQKKAGEHGSHRSPLLCEGKLFISTNEQLIAYDAATGNELWRTPGHPSGHGVTGMPVVAQVDGKRALQSTKNLVSLDGEVLAKRSIATWGCYVPIVENGVLYNSCNARHRYWFEAFAVPFKGKSEKNWKLNGRTLYGDLFANTLFFYVASPLYVDGMVYQVDSTGILVVVNTREKKVAYMRWMDGYNFNARSLYGYSASPTLAGDNIYLLDGAGHTTIIKPGAEGTVVGKNVLQNLSNMRNSAPGQQECFYAGMYFEGKRMFVHSDNYMYCILENGKRVVSTVAPVKPGDTNLQSKTSGISGKSKAGNDKTAASPNASVTKQSVPSNLCGFRGDGNGVYSNSKIPLKWSTDAKPKWKVEAGSSFGCPSVIGTYVFVTSEPDILHCVSLDDGRILWTRTHGSDQMPTGLKDKFREQSTECGYATPTPYTDGKHVWAVFGTGVVACYDMKGKRIWIRYIDLDQTLEYGRSASPVLADGKLMVTINHLTALDPKTGKTLWEQPETGAAYGTPAVTRIGKTEVIITPTGQIVSAKDGKILSSDLGTAANTTPVVHGDVVFFADGETSAFKLPKSIDGKPEELWYADLSGDIFASPVLYNGILYCMSNDKILYAINAADGEILYEEDLTGGDTLMDDSTEVYPSIFAANGHVFITNNAGETAVVKPGKEFSLVDVNVLEPGTGSTPAISGNILIIRSGSNLISF